MKHHAEEIEYCRSTNKVALVIGLSKIQYSMLRQTVDTLKESLDDKLLDWLPAEKSLEFIANLIAHLEMDIPAVVYSPQIPQEKLISLKSQIRKTSIHPNCQLILFTTGSEGPPKAVQLSKENINSSLRAIIDGLNFTDIENQILFLPLSYSFGLLGQLLPMLYLNKTTYIFDNLVPLKDHLELIRPEMISGVPSHLEAIMKIFSSHQLGSVKKVISAGAPLSPQLREYLIKTFSNAKIYNNYGQTELSPRGLILDSSSPHFLRGGTGKVVKGLQVKISNDGEVLFRGKQVMLGYVGQAGSNIHDGWLHTGDYGEIIDDVVYLKGRKDQLVKINGERVNLLEIETLVKEYMGIEKAAVLVHKSLAGEHLACYVNKSVNKKKLRDYLAEHLEPNKIPQRYYLVESFPLKNNGKVDRNGLSDNNYPAITWNHNDCC